VTRRPGLLALLVLVGGWLLAGVVTASPASAHASLVASTPADGARLDRAPQQVTLQFSEHVSIGPGYARVVGSDGSPVDTGTPAVTGDVLTLPLRGTLPAGGYVVTYRVVSADSHPISGAYSFAVGGGALLSAQAVRVQDSTDPGVAAALPVARWIGYAGLALGIGLPVLALACWPGGWRARRLTRPAVAGAGAVVAGAVLEFLLQGPDDAGSGLGTLLDGSLLSATAGSTAGRLLLVRVLAALALGGLLLAAHRRSRAPDPWQAVIGGLAALLLVVTTAGIGHASAGPWWGWALLSASVHVASMAVWLGGLAGLWTALLRPDVPGEQLADALPRFSRLAFAAVTTLIVTGTIQSVREVATPGALFTTRYGLVLTAKIVLVAVVLGAAGYSRVWVQQRYGTPGGRRPDGRRRVTAQAFAATAAAEAPAPGPEAADLPAALPAFRRSVLLEGALAAVVLALTAVLVGSPPAADAAPQPVDVTLPLQTSSGTDGSVEVSVAPAGTGVNSLHVYLFDERGQLAQPAGISVSLRNEAGSIGPLAVKLQPAGPGHWVADAMDIPGAGTWTLTVTVRVDEFTATTASTHFPVR
jgi:copper transport protein